MVEGDPTTVSSSVLTEPSGHRGSKAEESRVQLKAMLPDVLMCSLCFGMSAQRTSLPFHIQNRKG